LNDADLLRLSLTGQRYADCAVTADGDVGGRGWDIDGGLQRIAVRGDEIALRIWLERTGAGVARLSIGEKDLKEAAPLNRHVHRVASAAEVALSLHDFCVAGTRAEADLERLA
jgi:hypothetical protein